MGRCGGGELARVIESGVSWYNGAIEASNGAIKTRMLHLAAALGYPACCTCGDGASERSKTPDPFGFSREEDLPPADARPGDLSFGNLDRAIIGLYIALFWREGGRKRRVPNVQRLRPACASK